MIARIPVPVETRAPDGRTNAYLVGDSPDPSRDPPALLVDPPGECADLDAAVAGHDVRHLAVTHTHPDHVGGVGTYAERTGATVWARRGREARFERATGVAPDRTFAEGTTFLDGRVRVLDAPGHAPDHVAFAVDDGTTAGAPGTTDPAAAVLCGDLAVAEGSVVVAAPEGDMRAYLVGLRRLHARDPVRLWPGHGPVIEEPRSTLARLVAHRLDRERRVLAAVRTGACDPDAVLDAAYEKDLSGVRDLARATVVAHLEKLAAEGRVAWDPAAERVVPVEVEG